MAHIARLVPALLVSMLAMFAASAVSADNPVLVGRVIQVTDGDTIKVQLQSGPIKVRLDAIDAPESNQPGGAQATAALAALVANKTVELDVTTQDRYERLVAQITVNGTAVNSALIKQGHAWAFRRYTKNRDYCVWEHAARQLKRGLWAQPAKDWIYPSDWRRLKRKQITAPVDYSRETVATCIAALGKR